MAAPLSPTPSAALNFSTPSDSLHHRSFEARPFSMRDSTISQPDGYSTENGAVEEQRSNHHHHHQSRDGSPTPRGPSPPKVRPGSTSRIMSGSELSPLKILQSHQQAQVQAHQQSSQNSAASSSQQSQPTSTGSTSEDLTSPPPPRNGVTGMPPPPLPQSPRKAPIKRFPIRVNQPGRSPNESSRRPSNERRGSDEQRQGSIGSSLSENMLENEGLKHAIEIFEDDINSDHNDEIDMDNHDNDNNSHRRRDADGDERMGMQDETMDDDDIGANDTMASTFSTFSAVPKSTVMGMRSESPTKFSMSGGPTPRGNPSRTPRVNGAIPDRSGTQQLYDSGGSGNLMDFTENLRFGNYGAQPTPSRRGQAPMASSGRGVSATPQRNGAANNGNSNLVNLLDFDIPPMPTPRSVPTITPRELESLKSGFLSEISSLKASLSGKEAEVQHLKTAVGDAEKRVGECMEQLREIQDVHESLTTEKDNWERRGREMESVLRQVKEDIVMTQREREELEFKLHESEQRREAAEMMAQDAESKMAGMRAGQAAGSNNPPGQVINANKEVELAVERVAKDLHALYKSKHENKVAALKKSYETRWEKKVQGLQAQLDELTRENEDLRHGRANRINNLNHQRIVELEDERAQNAAHIRELEAESQKLEAILRTVQADNAELRLLLERERVEKGELVQLAEEMMNMQATLAAATPPPPPAPEPEPVRALKSPSPELAAPTPSKTPNRRQSMLGGPAKTPSSMGLGVRSSMPPPSRSAGLGVTDENNHAPVAAGGNNFRMSVGPGGVRASGLRAPGGAGKMMGLGRSGSVVGGPHERTKSSSSTGGLPRPGSGMGRGVMGGGGGGYSSGYGRRNE
ncbi:hypothetical protein QBC40DRAFT_225136 [Triangularia verruculosa]|uniref:Uncharacterized protein n=1 Tax=Triangularia verruculosa TaxID=2587418 RepID=A0AAN7AW80_9PEZI|nr:hypothetical protein QBC40DRAFT_225136 [Triangularia verruculosa]